MATTAGTKTATPRKTGLTDIKIRALKPRPKAYKVADQLGLYALVTAAGTVSFRYDYRLNNRRETLVIGCYDATRGAEVERPPEALYYGMDVSLVEARTLLARARRSVKLKESPAGAKAGKRADDADSLTFSGWAEKYFAGAGLAESTTAMRKSIYERDVKGTFGKKRLEEITPSTLMALCDKIKDPEGRNAPATAVHVRELVLQVFKFVQARGVEIDNPAEKIRPSAIARFKARDRALTPDEIRVFFKTLESVATMPTLRMALKFMLLTLVRKGEFINAQWPEVDFEAGTWTIPAERMKAGRPHRVYLSQQAQDILVAFRACFSASDYLHPGRYETDIPISNATLNRVIDATVARIREDGTEFESFTVHDLRRTASTLLHEAGFNSDWIEKCLAHEQKGVRAVYNKAEYAEQRREMLQQWATMVDGWIKGAKVLPFKADAAVAA